MFVESIEFKRTEESEQEKGYYVGDTDNSLKSIILDKNYNPITDYSHKNEEGGLSHRYRKMDSV